MVQYTCYVHSDTCVTWSLYCPQQNIPYSPNIGSSCNGSEQFSCPSSSGVVTMFGVRVTYSVLHTEVQSSLFIQVLSSSIPENGLMDMRIDCEDSRQYRYLSFEGMHVTIIVREGGAPQGAGGGGGGGCPPPPPPTLGYNTQVTVHYCLTVYSG